MQHPLPHNHRSNLIRLKQWKLGTLIITEVNLDIDVMLLFEDMAIREAMEHDVELATKEDIVANLAKEAEEVVLTLTIKAKMVNNKTQNVAIMMNKEDKEEVKEDDLEAVVDVDKAVEDVVYAVVTDVDHLAIYKEVVQILDI